MVMYNISAAIYKIPSMWDFSEVGWTHIGIYVGISYYFKFKSKEPDILICGSGKMFSKPINYDRMNDRAASTVIIIDMENDRVIVNTVNNNVCRLRVSLKFPAYYTKSVSSSLMTNNIQDSMGHSQKMVSIYQYRVSAQIRKIGVVLPTYQDSYGQACGTNGYSRTIAPA